MSLPGARLSGATLPPEVKAEEQDGALRLHFTTLRPFALKGADGGFDLVLYAPGLAGKVIMLDPGHGGWETGAVARTNGLKEKDVNLDVALKLRALLAAQDARVLMTRDADRHAMPPELEAGVAGDRVRADLNWRTRLANANKVDLYLSVHSNSGSADAQGTQTYYSSDSLNADRARALAGLVQAGLLQALGRPDGKVYDEIFYVVKFTEAPAALAELAYLSNPEEARLLAADAFRQQAAAGLARAVGRFFRERPDWQGLASAQASLAANPYRKALYEDYLTLAANADLVQDLDTYVNGKKASFDVRPVIRDNRTLVPIRAIAEALGATVGWDEKTQTVTITRDTSVLQLKIGSRAAAVSGKPAQVDVPAQIEGGRTLVPLRFVSEGLGLRVTWLDQYRVIVIAAQAVN